MPSATGLRTALLLLPAISLACGAAFCAAEEAPPLADGMRRTHVSLAVVEMTEPGFAQSTVIPVKRTLEAALPEAAVLRLSVSSATLESSVARLKPDFVISPAADFLRIVDAMGAHPIAVRRTHWAKDPSRSAGAAVITLATRTDITSLATLRGLRLAATLPTSIEGWLGLRKTLLDAGFRSDGFFREVKFLGVGMPNVVEAVLSGAYDAGVVPVCTLERIETEGLVEPGVLKVAAARNEPASACRTSTELYPDLVISALPTADPEVVRRAVAALLSTEPPDAEFGWYPVSDFHAVRQLEESLHVGPWAYLEDMTPAGIWRRWRFWILAGLGLLLLLIASELRLRRLVVKRTTELSASLTEQARLAESEAKTRERLSRLERMGAVSQLCALVAHELKQPVGAVINYLAVAKMKTGLGPALPGLPAPAPADPLLARAIEGADGQIRRISAIVDRVRGYARRERPAPVETDLYAVVASAKAGLKASVATPIHLAPRPGGLRPLVLGDPLELELIFHNLMKNALEAVQHESAGRVWVKVATTAGPVVLVTVADNGPALSDEAFARLSRVSASVKPEGLGLGLGIVRNLVEENGGRMEITRRSPHGLSVEVRFDLVRPGEDPGTMEPPAGVHNEAASAKTDVESPSSKDTKSNAAVAPSTGGEAQTLSVPPNAPSKETPQ